MSNSSCSSSEMYDEPPLWNSSCLFGGGSGTQVCIHPGTQEALLCLYLPCGFPWYQAPLPTDPSGGPLL